MMHLKGPDFELLLVAVSCMASAIPASIHYPSKRARLAWCPEHCDCANSRIVCELPNTLSAFPNVSDAAAKRAIKSIIIRNQPKLTALDFIELKDYSKLTNLIIEDCGLASIGENPLPELFFLENISLAYNHLTQIRWRNIRSVSKNYYILNVTGNPLNIDCTNQWLFDYDKLTQNSFDVDILRKRLSLISFQNDSVLQWSEQSADIKLIPAFFNLPRYVILGDNPTNLDAMAKCALPMVTLSDVESSDAITVVEEGSHLKAVCSLESKTRCDGGPCESPAAPKAKLLWMLLGVVNIDGLQNTYPEGSAKSGDENITIELTNLTTAASGYIICSYQSDIQFAAIVKPVVILGMPQFGGSTSAETSSSSNIVKPLFKKSKLYVDLNVYGVSRTKYEVHLYKQSYGEIELGGRNTVKLQLADKTKNILRFAKAKIQLIFEDYKHTCANGNYTVMIRAPISLNSLHPRHVVEFAITSAGLLLLLIAFCGFTALCLSRIYQLQAIREPSPVRIIEHLAANMSASIHQSATITIDSKHSVLPIVLIAVAVFVLFALGSAVGWLLFVFIKRRRHRKYPISHAQLLASGQNWELTPLNGVQQENESYAGWPSTQQFALATINSLAETVHAFPDIPMYKADDINVARLLGEGAFGRVYLAEFRGLLIASNEKTVECQQQINAAGPNTAIPQQHLALKQLKIISTNDKLADLKNEALVMSTLDHPNIVKFFGMTWRENSVALLFEYMDLGDLVNFLRDRSPGNNSSSCCQLQRLTRYDQLVISQQITAGLKYLSERRLVHRDLAARNCLVASLSTPNKQTQLFQYQIKISDFGMTRDIYVTDYYKMGDKALVPLRWLPPECILYRKFTTESDVYSLGVVFWEIFSFGRIPWSMFSNYEVFQRITQENFILEKIPECPEKVYQLMLKCWTKQPEDRISLAAILDELASMLVDAENSFYLNLVEVSRSTDVTADEMPLSAMSICDSSTTTITTLASY